MLNFNSFSWMQEGLCRNHDRSIFFSESRYVKELAKKICNECPITETCLEHAIKNNEVGVWGGTTESERSRLKIKRKNTS